MMKAPEICTPGLFASVVIPSPASTPSSLAIPRGDMNRSPGFPNSLFNAVRLVIGRLPRLHFPGDLSTPDADLAEKVVAGGVQPVKVLLGGHGFAAIWRQYCRYGNFDPAAVTS